MGSTATLASIRPIEAVRDGIAPPAGAVEEEKCLHAVRVYFAVYSAIDSVIGNFSDQILFLKGQLVPKLDLFHVLQIAVVIAGAIVFSRKKHYQWGALVLAGYHLLQVKHSF